MKDGFFEMWCCFIEHTRMILGEDFWGEHVFDEGDWRVFNMKVPV